jgi:hypothetical protein
MSKYKDTGCGINRIETTRATLCNRGGLAFILRYIESIGFFHLIENTVDGIRLNAKGKSASYLIRQILAFFIDGTYRAISDFDTVSKDDGYASILEVKKENLISSHTVKRFFKKFTFLKCGMLRKALNLLFIWRLQVVRPAVIVLDADTMVLDNDDAACREGVSPTYKQVKGFQNLQITWQGIVVDAIFRRGSAHSNHGNDVQESIRRMVNLIRSKYQRDIPIVLTIDSGFLDEKNLAYFAHTLGIYFVCFGKLYDSVKAYAAGCSRDTYKSYSSGKTQWEYLEFGSRLKSWNTLRFVRTIFTKLVSDDNGQMLLDFARPDSVLYTNIGMKETDRAVFQNAGCSEYLAAEGIISLAHGRGKNELVNRSLKDFMGSEHLPFKNFGMNAAYYYLMVIGHVMITSYNLDVLQKHVPQIGPACYPQTIRRRVVDFAACIVRSGGYVKLQITKALNEVFDCFRLWKCCTGEGLVPIPQQ